MDLRPYQRDMLKSISEAMDHGQRRLLIKSPTGTGKTVSFAHLRQHLTPWLAQFHEQQRQMLVIAHREELIAQSVEKIRAINPGSTVMIEQGEHKGSIYADVIVASIQTLSAMKFRRLQRYTSRTTFRIVVVDEAHHASAPTYRTALVHLGFLPPSDISAKQDIEAATFEDVAEMAKALQGWDAVAPKDRLLVGVTATPNRSDAIGLSCVFQSMPYSYALKDAIADGWLVPIVPWAVESAESLDEVRISRGDLNQGDLAQAVNTADRNARAVAAWRQYAEGQSTLAFTVDVQHAHDLAAVFSAVGVRAASISGETPKDERRDTLKRFSEGELEVVTNCMVLTEGTDLPRASCILHAKPTKSATLYEQMTGRGLRLYPGKTQCTVIDMVDVSRRHSLQAAPVLVGLPPSLVVNGKSLSKAAEDFEALRAERPGFDVEGALSSGRLTLDQLGLIARRVDPWAVPSLGSFSAGRQLQWIKVGESYRLRYPWADGTETVSVSRDMLDKWEVVLTMVPADGGPRRQRTVARELASEKEGAEIAEQFVLRERRSAKTLLSPDAGWRARPASEKQVALLRRLRVPADRIPKRCTMGQASDLINLAKARTA